VVHELRAGRKFAHDGKWDDALAAFEQALALDPENARVLGETGWVAFQGNNTQRAREANKRALANTNNPKLRSQILYNMGRVAESDGKKDDAKRDYAMSLALRDNAQVKSRLDSMGGVLDATRDDGELPCLQSHPNLDAMCKCLMAHKDSLNMNSDEGELVCGAEEKPTLPDKRLHVVEWGAGREIAGETVHLLVVNEGASARIVADLGRDFEPGAFGVHNGAEVKSAEMRTVSGHSVVIVRSEQGHSDSNIGGIELTTDEEKFDTLCALADNPGGTRCTPAIAVEASSSYGIGADPDPAELDDDMKETVERIRKEASSDAAKTAWTIGDDGKVTVKFVSGKRDLIPKAIFDPHPLW